VDDFPYCFSKQTGVSGAKSRKFSVNGKNRELRCQHFRCSCNRGISSTTTQSRDAQAMNGAAAGGMPTVLRTIVYPN
jgi:hypothetical protein